MKNVAIKFCSADEARERAKVYMGIDFIRNNSVYGISEDLYEKLNDLPYVVIKTDGESIEIELRDNAYIGVQLFIPKIFLDISEI